LKLFGGTEKTQNKKKTKKFFFSKKFPFCGLLASSKIFPNPFFTLKTKKKGTGLRKNPGFVGSCFSFSSYSLWDWAF